MSRVTADKLFFKDGLKVQFSLAPAICTSITIKILKMQTPEKFAVITLKFEQSVFAIEQCIPKMQTK